MKDPPRAPAAPKPPAAPATKGISPAPPPVAAKTIGLAGNKPAAPHAPPAPFPLAATPLPSHVSPKPPAVAPAHPPSAPPPSDDSWDDAPTKIEDEDIPTAALRTAARAQAEPLKAAIHLETTKTGIHFEPPKAAPQAPQPKEDVNAIVRAAVDAALAPVLASLRDLERRLAPIERLAASATTPPPAPAPRAPDPYAAAMARLPAAPTPAIAAVVAPPAAAAPAPVAVAAAPAPVARSPYALPTPGPVLDLAAINRDQSIDFDMPFDGARRRKRMAMGCGLIFVLSLGGLFAILIGSYMR